MDNRDNSKEAILERYRRANELAIATSSKVLFESIRDVRHLVLERERLEETIAVLKAQIALLEGK